LCPFLARPSLSLKEHPPLKHWSISKALLKQAACAKMFPDGEAYVVPGLGHGNHSFGPDFVEHVRHFIGTQLGDWK